MILLSYFLRSDVFLHRDWIIWPAFHSWIVGYYHTFYTEKKTKKHNNLNTPIGEKKYGSLDNLTDKISK
jgi:hypothetical protein